MLATRRLPAVLLLLAVFVGGLGRSGWGDGAEAEPRQRLRQVRAGLLSPHDPARAEALARLEALLPQLEASARRDLVRPLADVLARRPPRDAALAVGFLARLEGDKARDLWLESLRGDADPRVFLAALEAAAHRRGDAESVRRLLAAARSPREDRLRRALALEALGLLDCSPARLLLEHPAEPPTADGSEDWVLASGRALGLGRMGGRAAPAPLIALLGHPHPAPRVHAWESLERVTGLRLPPDADAWRGAFAGGAEAAPRPEPSASPDDPYRQQTPLHVPRYYGIPVDKARSHVVFCLDVSQSMYGRGIDTARRQLHEVLTAFPTSYAFDVVAFNEHVTPFAGALWPAHPVVKARALAFVEALETLSYTNLFDAVEVAFGLGGLGPRAAEEARHLDAIFLLSDGAPNRGRIRDEDRIVQALRDLSRGRVPIHAIAAGEEVFPLLQRIADATGGRFVDAFLFD